MWKVLVVDDSFNNCELMAEWLREVAVCDLMTTGEDAVVAYKKAVEANQPYDMILLDISMPGIDGLDVLKAVRSKEEDRGILLGSGVPIIIVTAYKEPFLDAFNKGCDDYILKPIAPDYLIEKLQGKLDKKKNQG